MNIIKRKEKLIEELRNKEYRDAFVSEHIDTGIPFQIRALREQRGWTQKELATLAGVSQVWISRIENPNYDGFSIKTLLKLSSAFDVGLIVRFSPISELVRWELELSPESLKVVSFDEDPYFKPHVMNIIGQGGFVMGREGIGSCCYPEPKTMGKLIDIKDARQKAAMNKIDEYQKERDMPLLASLSGLKQ